MADDSMKKPEDPTRILIVANDPIVCDSLSNVLRGLGYSTATAISATEAMDAIREAEQIQPNTRRAESFQVVITDINLADQNGLDLLRELRDQDENVVVIVVTAYGTIQSAVKAIKLGAFDYLTYPVVEEELGLIVEKAARQARLIARNSMLE